MKIEFYKTIMKNDLENGVVDKIVTRFPPEPMLICT